MDLFDDDGRTSDDNIGQILRAAFAALARGAFGDSVSAPPMSETAGPSSHRLDEPGRWKRNLLWAAVAAALVAGVAGVVAASTNLGPRKSVSGLGTAAAHTTRTSTPTHSRKTTPTTSRPPSRHAGPPPKRVRVTSDLNDGAEVGVGEPIVLNFSPAPTDSAQFTKAVTVTVNGRPADGAWYWEKPYADQPIQAHYREPNYWPANATIKVRLPIAGRSAGRGLAYSGALTSVTFATGDAHVSIVNNATKTMTVTNNGQLVRTVPVSLGAATTPTYNGTKVVMQKGEDIPGSNTLRSDGTVMMSGPGYTDDPVPWSVRVTASGEYVHAAGWNTNIGIRDTSNGCTNLKPADGEWFYGFSRIGDVVKYINTDGTPMNPLDGLGDWNIPWSAWSLGGRLLNH
jgi:lipoprotein-anchoring transpeptidase ErfK/SrfK